MNTLEAALGAMKQGFDAESGNDTEKLKVVWNYKENEISVYLKYKHDTDAHSPGPVPFKDNPDSVRFGKMLLNGLKEKLINCRDIIYMIIIFDLENAAIEKTEVYYFDNDNKKQTFKDGK